MRSCLLPVFFTPSPLIAPYVHLFPTSTRASAPYTVDVEFHLFSQEESIRRLNIEGARLHQPDGISISSLFTEDWEGLKETCGLTIQFICERSGIDLNNSSAMIEFRNKDGSSLKYWAMGKPSKPEGGALVVSDFSIVASLLVINSSLHPGRVTIEKVEGDGSAPGLRATYEFPKFCVKEFALNHLIDSTRRNSQVTDLHGLSASLIKMNFETLGTENDNLGSVVGAYIVYRNRATGKLVSASSVT